MSNDLAVVPEIEPEEFEDELRRGDPIVIIDTRDAASFDAWHVDPLLADLRNRSEAEIVADPDAALAGVERDARVRVICNAGNASRRAVAALAGTHHEARSVRGGMIGWSRVLQRDELPLRGHVAVVQFRREARGCLSYLLAADGEAIVVDPAPRIDAYLDEARRRRVSITRVVDTHVHADHLSGARDLAAATGATRQMSVAALARGIRDADAIVPISDGDRLPIGRAAVRVLALPGHTTDVIGLRVGDEALVAGDSLFVAAVARPDLEAGDEGAAAAARALHETITTRILTLPDDLLLLPCHYPGGRSAGAISIAIADVRTQVPAITLGVDEFVRETLAAMPPRPANYLEIIAANLGNAPDPDAAARLEVGANNCAAR